MSDALTPPGIIDQVIQSPTCSFFHLLSAGIDAVQLIHLQTKGDDTQVRQILNGFGFSCRGENSQALGVELASKSVTDASGVAPVAYISGKFLLNRGREMLPGYEYSFARLCHWG